MPLIVLTSVVVVIRIYFQVFVLLIACGVSRAIVEPFANGVPMSHEIEISENTGNFQGLARTPNPRKLASHGISGVTLTTSRERRDPVLWHSQFKVHRGLHGYTTASPMSRRHFKWDWDYPDRGPWT